MIDIKHERQIVDSVARKLDALEGAIEREEEELEQAEKSLNQTLQAQEILQRVAQTVQQQAHEKIAGVVSTCLNAVFDDPYEFNIEFERKRGRTEATLQFKRRKLTVDPLSASGGGVVDVAAFALRAACLMLHRPRLTRLIVLDEPFKFLSEEYRPNIKAMLEELAEELSLQIILVTHIDALETGKIITLR